MTVGASAVCRALRMGSGVGTISQAPFFSGIFLDVIILLPPLFYCCVFFEGLLCEGFDPPLYEGRVC